MNKVLLWIGFAITAVVVGLTLAIRRFARQSIEAAFTGGDVTAGVGWFTTAFTGGVYLYVLLALVAAVLVIITAALQAGEALADL